MRVLVLGGGGREHAIVWKLSQSERVDEIYCVPGNGGISDLARCIDISLKDHEGIKGLVRRERIDLVVVGPEGPLADGIADLLEASGVAVFGPSKRASQIESSKVFAKSFMRQKGVRTADFKSFDSYEEARRHLRNLSPPYVVKADGLCGGKGVYVIHDGYEGETCLRNLMVDGLHGEAGKRVVVEEFLEGLEVSYIVVTDGERIVPFLPSQDHKPLLDDDKGPNTGGMGAYAPVPFVTDELEQVIRREIMERTIKGLQDEGIKYKGALYGGLMIARGEPYVLEFNVRFGDPETQPILFLMESDLLPLLLKAVEGRLSEVGEISWRDGVSVCVILASQGYPGKPLTGREIRGLESLKGERDVMAFHAGTKKVGGRYVTDGGRVLGITAVGKSYKDAIDKAYEAVKGISFEGMQFRKDIGRKALYFGGNHA
jgi:phosphoribosylamine--glycine ligase